MTANTHTPLLTAALLFAATIASAQPPAPLAPAALASAPGLGALAPPPVAPILAQTPRPTARPETPGQPPAPAVPKVVKGTVPPPDAPPAPPPSTRPKGQLVNVKVEFNITDQVGTKPPTRKVMVMTVADGEYSRIRTNADVYQKALARFNEVPLSVDVNPVVDGNKVRLSFTLEYTLLDAPPEEGAPGGKTGIAERLAVVLDSNVPVVVAQSTDPITDRKVTVEVKATIVK